MPIMIRRMRNFGVGKVTMVVNLVVSVFVIILLQVLGMVIFGLMTPFKDMEELKRAMWL